MKNLLRRAVKMSGYELCRISDSERSEVPAEAANYKETQIYRALAPSGQISIEEARGLSDLVRQSDPKRPIIEVGILYGLSTLVMCIAKHADQPLLAVDNFSWNSLGVSREVHEAATRKRLAECVERYGVEIHAKSAAAFYESYSGPPPALYFCDADHSYEAVRADIAWARKIGASIICGDDFAPRHEGVTRAVNEAGGPRQLFGELWVL